MTTFNALIYRAQYVKDRLSELSVTGPKNAEILYQADRECSMIISDLKEALYEITKANGEEIQNEGELEGPH